MPQHLLYARIYFCIRDQTLRRNKWKTFKNLLYNSNFISNIFVILENFCYCLIQKTLGELPDFEVMTWQLCRMLRSALICYSSNSFQRQK